MYKFQHFIENPNKYSNNRFIKKNRLQLENINKLDLFTYDIEKENIVFKKMLIRLYRKFKIGMFTMLIRL